MCASETVDHHMFHTGPRGILSEVIGRVLGKRKRYMDSYKKKRKEKKNWLGPEKNPWGFLLEWALVIHSYYPRSGSIECSPHSFFLHQCLARHHSALIHFTGVCWSTTQSLKMNTQGSLVKRWQIGKTRKGSPWFNTIRERCGLIILSSNSKNNSS